MNTFFKRLAALTLVCCLVLGGVPSLAISDGVEDIATHGDLAPQVGQAVQAAQSLLDALPAADAVTADDEAVYLQLQAAYDAYSALTADQQAQITGAEKFAALFAVFGQFNTLEDGEYTIKFEDLPTGITEGAVKDAAGNTRTSAKVGETLYIYVTLSDGYALTNASATIWYDENNNRGETEWDSGKGAYYYTVQHSQPMSIVIPAPAKLYTIESTAANHGSFTITGSTSEGASTISSAKQGAPVFVWPEPDDGYMVEKVCYEYVANGEKTEEYVKVNENQWQFEMPGADVKVSVTSRRWPTKLIWGLSKMARSKCRTRVVRSYR